MKKFILIIVIFLLTTSVASAYDMVMAESYNQYFKPFSEKATGKSLHMISTAAFVRDIRAGKLFVLDVRTPGETGIYGLTVPGTIVIPMDQVFKPENLANLPTTGKIVIV